MSGIPQPRVRYNSEPERWSITTHLGVIRVTRDGLRFERPDGTFVDVPVEAARDDDDVPRMIDDRGFLTPEAIQTQIDLLADARAKGRAS